jgi:hypothetical protein
MNRATLVSRPENDDEFRRRMLNAIVVGVIGLFAMIVVGCGGGGEDDLERQRGTGNQTVGERDPDATEGEMPGGSSVGGSSLATQTITVTLKDNEIAMPTIIKPGPTTFNVVNAGQVEHGLTIEGNGQEQELAGDLDPGKAAPMEMDLLPGTYKVYSPGDDGEEKGLTLQLTVQP